MSNRRDELVDELARVVLVLADVEASAEQRQAALEQMIDATRSDADMFCVFWTLSVAATTALRHTHGIPAGEHLPLVLAEFDGREGKVVDAGDAPPRVALLGRWLAAASNQDLDTSLALYKTVPIDDNLGNFAEDVTRACTQLLQAATRRAGS